MNNYFEYRDSTIYAKYTHDDKPDKNEFYLHTHEMCELYCMLEGKGTFKVEGTSYDLHSGDILVMSPGEAHYMDIDPSLGYTRISIHFSPTVFADIDSEGSLLSPFLSRERGRLNLYRPTDFGSSNVRMLLAGIMSPSSDKRLQVLCALLPLLWEIKNASECRRSDDIRHSAVREIIEYINDNLTDDVSLDGICDRFYISKPQLCRIFKQATGSGVWEYITAKRLLTARSMIHCGTPATVAAEACGWSDYSVFFKSYKKRFGISPGRDGAGG